MVDNLSQPRDSAKRTGSLPRTTRAQAAPGLLVKEEDHGIGQRFDQRDSAGDCNRTRKCVGDGESDTEVQDGE